MSSLAPDPTLAASAPTFAVVFVAFVGDSFFVAAAAAATNSFAAAAAAAAASPRRVRGAAGLESAPSRLRGGAAVTRERTSSGKSSSETTYATYPPSRSTRAAAMASVCAAMDPPL